VDTKYLKRTVKKHLKRFPVDFMFQLDDKEWEILRCQIGLLFFFLTTSQKRAIFILVGLARCAIPASRTRFRLCGAGRFI